MISLYFSFFFFLVSRSRLVRFVSTSIHCYQRFHHVCLREKTQIGRKSDRCTPVGVSRNTIRFDLHHSVVRYGQSAVAVSLTINQIFIHILVSI